MSWNQGLTPVSTEALKILLKAVYKQDVSCPLTLPDLTRVGLQYCAGDLLDVLRGLEERTVRVVLTTVIAERRV